jgi:hypothetical protein
MLAEAEKTKIGTEQAKMRTELAKMRRIRKIWTGS